MITYDKNVIAHELTETALGRAFYGNALRVAKDFPFLTAEDRSVLDRWATGGNVASDTWELQYLAIKIRCDG